MKFPKDSIVMHVKTGCTYRIIIGPDEGMLEKTGEPAYTYRYRNVISRWEGKELFHRSQAEMEDGRFSCVEDYNQGGVDGQSK